MKITLIAIAVIFILLTLLFVFSACKLSKQSDENADRLFQEHLKEQENK